MTNAQESNNQEITVLELRNYLLKPNTADGFRKYFNTYFVTPMHDRHTDILRIGQRDTFVFDMGGREHIWKLYGLDPKHVAKKIEEWL